MMSRLSFLLLFLALTGTIGNARPNIIYILADDLGYGDLGCYGQKTLKTPHLDRLAAEGMRFTRHYAGSTVCAPSRCVLMTGLHTGRCRVRGNGNMLLRAEDITLAEVLQENGYTTGCFGKWGIGHPPPRDDPNRHGFEEFFGYVNMHHAHNFYPEFLIRNGDRVALRNVTKPEWKVDDRLEGGSREGSGVATVKVDYAPYLIMDEAVAFIEKNRGRPFFLYLALNTPHANNEGGRDEELLDGMEVPDHGEFADQDWPNPEKGFAVMIRDIDNFVGQIRDALEDNGIEDNLIVFSSDNGPHQEGNHEMEFFDSNGSLNGMKRDLTDGGVRVPMIAHWDGKITPGETTNHLSGFQDIMPTLIDLLVLDTAKEIPTTGISFLPTLLGDDDAQEKHPYLYWEFQERGGKVAVTTGKWKLIKRGTLRKGKKAETFLFDLENDPGELSNVAKQFPDVVGELEAMMDAAHVEVGED